MSKGTKVLLFMLVILAGVYVMAADQVKDNGVGQIKTLELFQPATLGTTQLPAGEYKVAHLMDGGNHVLVFTNSSRKEVARVNCTMVELPKKAEITLGEFTTKDNARVLTGITFRGDKFKHQF